MILEDKVFVFFYITFFVEYVEYWIKGKRRGIRKFIISNHSPLLFQKWIEI